MTTEDPEPKGWFSPDASDRPAAAGEAIAVVRKKALLRILARREAERANIRPSAAEIEDMSEQFRRSFGLTDAAAFARWLAASALGPEGYEAAMRDFAVVRLVEDYCAREIDALVPEQVAISSARLRVVKSD
jgi:hypothetical protein